MYFWTMHLLSSFSLWWIFPIFLLAAAVSWLFYKKEHWLKEKHKYLKYSLISIRTLSIGLIISLLLGLLIEQSHFQTEQPILLTLVDHSSSMMNYTDSRKVESQIEAFNTAIQKKFKGRYKLKAWHFGQNLNFKQKGFDAKQTNLQLPFESAANQFFNANLGAIVLISDGNYNVGQHPMYAAENLPLTSVFCLAVGDTTSKKDLILSHVAYNELAFLNNTFPIEIDVEAKQFAGAKTKVILYENGKQIANQSLQVPKGKSSRTTLQFNCKALKAGINEYKVKVEPLNGEFSLQNNQRTFYIEIIDSRNKILIYSQAPHPDVAALQEALVGNQLNEVVVQYANQLDLSKINSYDLVIWHDPGQNFNNQLFSSLEKNNLPVWYILGTQTDQAIANKIAHGLSFSLKQQSEEVLASAAPSFSIYEANSIFLDLLKNMPPLTKKFGDVNAKAGVQTLLQQRIGEIIKNQPLLSFYRYKQNREAYLIGEGIWKWRILTYLKKQSHEAFDQFINEITSYLMVKKEGSGLRVQAPKKRTVSENCVLSASFYNEALQAITSPEIKWELKDERNKLRKGTFSTKGSYYQQQLGKLKAGRYYWKVYTSFNNKKFVKSGAFVVEDIELESLESAARHSTLYQLAAQNQGKVFPLKAYQRLINTLAKKNDLVDLRTESHHFDPLIDYQWLLLMILCLLSLEWFLRRYFGAY